MGDSLQNQATTQSRRQSDIPRSDRQSVFLLFVHGLHSLMTTGGSDSKVDYPGNRGLFRAPGNQIHPSIIQARSVRYESLPRPL